METKHKGAHSELAACVWLLEQGYEVFRNVSQHGTTDVVVVKYDMLWRVDVKTASTSRLTDGTIKNYNSFKPPKGIRALIALSNGDFVWGDQWPGQCIISEE